CRLFGLACPRIAALRSLPSFPPRRSSDLFRLRLRHLRAATETGGHDRDTDFVAHVRIVGHADDDLGIVRAHVGDDFVDDLELVTDRKSTRLNSSHVSISYAVFCLQKKRSL